MLNTPAVDVVGGGLIISSLENVEAVSCGINCMIWYWG